MPCVLFVLLVFYLKNPLRDIQVSTTKARQHFGINCSRKTILVVGGSLGARSINMAVVNSVNEWVDKGVQVIHITGKLGGVKCKLHGVVFI